MDQVIRWADWFFGSPSSFGFLYLLYLALVFGKMLINDWQLARRIDQPYPKPRIQKPDSELGQLLNMPLLAGRNPIEIKKSRK